MNLAFRLKMAKQKAERFLRDEGIASLPVDPFAIATSRNIEVRAKPDTEGGVSGMLLRHGDNFGILYATHVRSEGFQRFSISHELGHYFLDGHVDHILPDDGIHTSCAGFISTNPYELEADHFAAGLLMPASIFRKELSRLDSGLSAVEAMAQLCRTSLTATAIRCAELSRDAIAAVISDGPTIDYCFLSDRMKDLPDLTWLRKGSPVPKGTATAQINNNPSAVSSGERAVREIDALDWLGGSRSIIMTEEVVGLGNYGKTLTILSIETLSDDDVIDGDADDDLIERWTPRFHK